MILAIETSCDDTCAAVVDGAGAIRSNVVSSQGVHDRFGGVVPEIASRHHLELVNAVVDDALRGRQELSLEPHVAFGQRCDDRVRIERAHLIDGRNLVLDRIRVTNAAEGSEELRSVGRLRLHGCTEAEG